MAQSTVHLQVIHTANVILLHLYEANMLHKLLQKPLLLAVTDILTETIVLTGSMASTRPPKVATYK